MKNRSKDYDYALEILNDSDKLNTIELAFHDADSNTKRAVAAFKEYYTTDISFKLLGRKLGVTGECARRIVHTGLLLSRRALSGQIYSSNSGESTIQKFVSTWIKDPFHVRYIEYRATDLNLYSLMKALKLKYVDKLSNEDISKQLKVTERTVVSLIDKAEKYIYYCNNSIDFADSDLFDCIKKCADVLPLDRGTVSRAYNVLARNCIYEISEFLEYDEESFLKLRNVGRTTVDFLLHVQDRIRENKNIN